jgi:hypothetical protein
MGKRAVKFSYESNEEYTTGPEEPQGIPPSGQWPLPCVSGTSPPRPLTTPTPHPAWSADGQFVRPSCRAGCRD